MQHQEARYVTQTNVQKPAKRENLFIHDAEASKNHLGTKLTIERFS